MNKKKFITSTKETVNYILEFGTSVCTVVSFQCHSVTWVAAMSCAPCAGARPRKARDPSMAVHGEGLEDEAMWAHVRSLNKVWLDSTWDVLPEPESRRARTSNEGQSSSPTALPRRCAPVFFPLPFSLGYDWKCKTGKGCTWFRTQQHTLKGMRKHLSEEARGHSWADFVGTLSTVAFCWGERAASYVAPADHRFLVREGNT
jgi:hypothetical protein